MVSLEEKRTFIKSTLKNASMMKERSVKIHQLASEMDDVYAAQLRAIADKYWVHAEDMRQATIKTYLTTPGL
jgi:lipopolysaccharide biosynthesis glycosyltransferase